MLMERQAIIEYVKEKIIQMRYEGKLDFERTTGASLRLDFYRDLYPGKVHPSVKSEEERNPGILDKIISQGIALGLTAPPKVLKPENVNLTEAELKEISWDVKMALSKKGITGDDPAYAGEYQALAKQFEAERLAEKRAKLTPEKKSDKAMVNGKARESKPAPTYSKTEQELVNALTYVEDLKKLLTDSLAKAEAYLEMDRDLLLVWQRLEREGKPKDIILIEALAEIAPSRPKQKEEMIMLAQSFWLLFAKAVSEASKSDSLLTAKLRNNYRAFINKGLNKEQAKKETYSLMLKSEDTPISRARIQVFSQLFPQPIELRFKRSFKACRKPSHLDQSPLPMGEALKTALERALTMAPSLMAKKSVLDKMSREKRAFMPTGKLKRRKAP